MKSIVNTRFSPTKPFPKLMKSLTSGNIWLMQDKTSGVAVHLDDDKEYPFFFVGYISNGLNSSDFVDFYGTVTLENG